MIRNFFPFVFLFLFLLSCDKDDNENSVKRTKAPVGETFSDGLLTLVFETSDSLVFSYRDTPVEGKSAYMFKNDTIRIENPHGERLDPEDVKEPHFLGLTGVFVDYNRMDVNYGLVGEGEKIQIIGKTNLKKQNTPNK